MYGGNVNVIFHHELNHVLRLPCGRRVRMFVDEVSPASELTGVCLVYVLVVLGANCEFPMRFVAYQALKLVAL